MQFMVIRQEPTLRADILEGDPAGKKKSFALGGLEEEFANELDTQHARTRTKTEAVILEMPDYEGPDNLPEDMLQKLEKGDYHVGGMLDNFGVEWNREKCARDVWQNFFDANNQSLDNVEISVEEGNDEFIIKIEGLAIYDPRLLLHIGGTTKTRDKSAAGGFGEGTAVSSFVMLKDFEASEITFESVGWNMKFNIKQMQAGATTKKQSGLFAQLTKNPDRKEGNNITIRTKDRQLAEALVGARDLFYHSGNEDFKNPTFDNEVGGFKILEKDPKKSYGNPLGHLYDAGQRRHFTDVTKWDTLEWMHFWTKEKTLPKDRERGKTDGTDVNKFMIDHFVKSLSLQDCEEIVYKMISIWDKTLFYTPVARLMEGVCKKLGKAKKKLSFPENCLASDIISYSQDRLLIDKGYRLCPGYFEEIGMQKKSVHLRSLETHYRVEANEVQERKIGILLKVAGALGRAPKNVWLYSRTEEKNISRGQYVKGGDYVWICSEELDLPFYEAVGTYVHELDHEHGNDATREHGEALTNSITNVLRSAMNNPAQWAELNENWDKT